MRGRKTGGVGASGREPFLASEQGRCGVEFGDRNRGRGLDQAGQAEDAEGGLEEYHGCGGGEGHGAAGGFSGPIVRGDVATVQRHLEVLRRSRVPCQVYAALVRAALEYLPANNRTALKRLLDSN